MSYQRRLASSKCCDFAVMWLLCRLLGKLNEFSHSSSMSEAMTLFDSAGKDRNQALLHLACIVMVLRLSLIHI